MTVTLAHGDSTVMRVDPEHVDQIAALVEPLLERSIPYTEGFQTIDQMIDSLRQGVRPWQLWAIAHRDRMAGAFITTLERYGDDLVMTFEVIGGVEAQSWIAPLIANFEEYMAAMYGVTYARVVGRKGWERFLSRYGYEPTHFVTSKRLLDPADLHRLCVDQ